jgi:hypothetical protein
LGIDFAQAKAKCDEILNPQFEAWRKGNSFVEGPLTGTFNWMVEQYKSSPKWLRLAEGSRGDYDRVLSLVAEHKLRDNRSFGQLPLKSITPGAADKIHAQLSTTHGGQRQRTAKLAMDVCRRAWSVAYRSYPGIVPSHNPFSKMGLFLSTAHNASCHTWRT